MTDPVAVPPREAVATPDRRPVRRRLLLALTLLAVVVVLELLAGSVLSPPRPAHADTAALAVPGVAAMMRGTDVDPTELGQVTAARHGHDPLAFGAQALLDGLLLAAAAAASLPQLFPAAEVTRGARLGSFLASLGILLGGIMVVVGATRRVRELVGLYLSPPLGTFSYLLWYSASRRSQSLVALTVLMAVKATACAALARAGVRSSAARGLFGLALTSLAATVVTAVCYAWAPADLATVTDALAAAVVGLTAVLWAGVFVSGSVRRLA